MEVKIQFSKEVYTRKRIHDGSLVRIENSVTQVTVQHYSASLLMTNSYSRDGIFNPHLTTIKDSYSAWPIFVCRTGIQSSGWFSSRAGYTDWPDITRPRECWLLTGNSMYNPVEQIRRIFEDKWGRIFLISPLKHSLGDSNHTFFMENWQKIIKYPILRESICWEHSVLKTLALFICSFYNDHIHVARKVAFRFCALLNWSIQSLCFLHLIYIFSVSQYCLVR